MRVVEWHYVDEGGLEVCKREYWSKPTVNGWECCEARALETMRVKAKLGIGIFRDKLTTVLMFLRINLKQHCYWNKHKNIKPANHTEYTDNTYIQRQKESRTLKLSSFSISFYNSKFWTFLGLFWTVICIIPIVISNSPSHSLWTCVSSLCASMMCKNCVWN